MVEVALLLACVAVVAIPALKHISFGVNKNACAAVVMTESASSAAYADAIEQFRVKSTGEGVCRRNTTFINPYYSTGAYF